MRRDAPLPDLAGGAGPEIISAAEMDVAVGNGQATGLSQVITFIRRYRATWWLSTEAGWLPIPRSVAAVLDQHAQRIEYPEVRGAADQAAIRAVIELVRDATNPG